MPDTLVTLDENKRKILESRQWSLYNLVESWEKDTLKDYNSIKEIFETEIQNFENKIQLIGQFVNLITCTAVFSSHVTLNFDYMMKENPTNEKVIDILGKMLAKWQRAFHSSETLYFLAEKQRQFRIR